MPKINSTTDSKEELKVLNTEIAERHRYFVQQEAQIKELVEGGNTQLMGLHHDILVATQKLRDIKTDIRTAAQDKVLLNEDLDSIRSEIQVSVGLGPLPAFG